MTNRETLEDLFANGRIDICRSGLFGRSPEPLLPDFDFDRIEGMMLGLAATPLRKRPRGGDAEGIPKRRSNRIWYLL